MITVKNFETCEKQINEQNGNKFSVKSIMVNKNGLHADFVEVEPQNFAYGYHWHEVNEEAFYIISGAGIVKTPEGEIKVEKGDIINFPTGEQGAHVIRNASETEKLIYLDFGINYIAEIVHFPEIDKIMAIGPYSNGIY